MTIRITKDPDEYVAYHEDLRIEVRSPELFKCLVMMNDYLTNNGHQNLLSDPDIVYIMDSQTMVSMISSNVELLKRLNRMPSKFQQSQERFGVTPQQKTPDFNRSTKSTDSFTSEWSKLSRKSKKTLKFNK